MIATMSSVIRATGIARGSPRGSCRAAPAQQPRQCRWRARAAVLPRCSAAEAASEQLTLVAARLSTVRCRELLAASCVELLKTALVGSAASAAADDGSSADPPAQAGSAASNGSSQAAVTPEAILEQLHSSLQASLQDAAHQIAGEHQEAWAHSQWEAFQAAHAVVQRLLYDVHAEAAAAGSAVGALQMARCLEHGLLVPQSPHEAFAQYKRAAQLGSAEAALRCGIHFFEGTAPGGRDGAQAFDGFALALELVDKHGDASGGTQLQLPQLATPSPDTAVEGDVPQLLAPSEVRFSALTWTGRCYLEGAGVERSIKEAARCFREAGNAAELAELTALKLQFAEICSDDLSAGP